MQYPLRINYKYTNSIVEAKQWINELPSIIACDFEAASMYTKKEKDVFKYRLENRSLSFEEQRILYQKYESDGLSHPSLAVITHLSVAWSSTDSFVIVCDTNLVRKFVYYFLITTDKLQIWHNTLFDFKHIFYNTNKLPIKYIDTFLLAKTLLNDANPLRCKVGLKELMGYAYGDWALAKDKEKGQSPFVLENMWDEKTLKYAATDSCATFKLYKDIQEDLNKWKI